MDTPYINHFISGGRDFRSGRARAELAAMQERIAKLESALTACVTRYGWGYNENDDEIATARALLAEKE